MPTFAFVTLLALTLSLPHGAGNAKVHRHGEAARRAPLRTDQLFSLRERRRVAAYLRMRLLEMREEGLARAAAAVERRLPRDVLFGPP
jgi:hypothetical protein